MCRAGISLDMTRLQSNRFSLNQAKFPREPLEAFGGEVFQGRKLRDLPRKVVITSFLLDNEAQGSDRSWEPRIHHNLPLKRGSFRVST